MATSRRNTLRRPRPVAWAVAFLLAPIACVSIPKEAPELSTELGKRIGAMETAHLGMLHTFMDTKRAAVDQFLMREWVPAFAADVMTDPLIQKTWDEVCKTGTAQDRLRFLTTLGPKLQAKINAKRLELIQPLDQLETTIERRLRDEYEQMKGVNNAISSFLVSAAKVAESRDRYLNMLGISNDLANALDAVETATADLVRVRDTAVDKVDIFNTFKAQIADAIRSLKTPKN